MFLSQGSYSGKILHHTDGRSSSNKGLALLDVLLELGQARVNQRLLIRRDLANGVDLFNTVRAKLDIAREEVDAVRLLVERVLDESRGDDALLAANGAQQCVGEDSCGVCHGKGRGAGTILGLDNLITTVLDTVDQLGVVLALDGSAELRLGEEGNDGHTGVATNNRDGGGCRVSLARDLREEAGSADDIERGDTVEEKRGVRTCADMYEN